MAFAPGFQDIDHRTQAFSGLRQAIFDTRRNLGIDLADHQTVILKRTELLGQHALGDAGHPPPQLAKALGAILQVIEDHALPFAVDQIERRFDRAAWPAREIPSFHGPFPIVSKQGLYPQIYSTCQNCARPTIRPMTIYATIRETTGMKAVGRSEERRVG